MPRVVVCDTCAGQGACSSPDTRPRRAYAFSMERLPLFPLGATLLPGAPLALQIFEPRYVQLLRDLLAADSGEPVFGVVGIRLGHEVGRLDNALHDVGCTARIEQVGELGDGLFGLLATGDRRFHLDALVDEPDTAYQVGTVTYLDERVGDPRLTATLATRLTRAVQEHRRVHGLPEVEAPDDPTALSYWAARATELEASAAQRLLAEPDTSSRLDLALRLTQREIALGTQLGAMGSLLAEPPSLN